MAQIFLWELSGLPTTGQIRVEVVPLDGRKDYWAFASVTHNETQQVTAIVPN